MRYNGSPGKILLSGLTPGKPYAFAFYNQAWKRQFGHLVLLRPSGNRHRRPKSIQLIQPDGQLVECRHAADSTEVIFTAVGSWYLFGFSNREAESENHLFALDANGTLRNRLSDFDFESDQNHSIRVLVTDDHGISIIRNLIVSVSNAIEDLDGDGIEDHLDTDLDGDGLSNLLEQANGSNPADFNSLNLAPSSITAFGSFTLPENEPAATLLVTSTPAIRIRMPAYHSNLFHSIPMN